MANHLNNDRQVVAELKIEKKGLNYKQQHQQQGKYIEFKIIIIIITQYQAIGRRKPDRRRKELIKRRKELKRSR